MIRRVALLLLVTPLLTAPASAGIFNFNSKKPEKPNPADRVPELVKIVQTDGDEDKRVSAAEELRDYDPAQFPDVVPVLIDVMLNDKKPGVRAEAAQSLGKIRPITDQVGLALEQCLAKDGSMRVRLQARSVLVQYRWSGWKEPAAKKDEIPTARPKEPPPSQSKEPPLAPVLPAPPRLGPTPVAPPPVAPPPAAPPPAAPPVVISPSVAPPAAPQSPPAGPAEDGPLLNPPG